MTISDGTIGAKEWARQHLVALRDQTGLSQAKFAPEAKIPREVYNALEKGRRAMTLTYAPPIAAALTRLLDREVTAEELLPPGSGGASSADPFALLRELSETVEQHKKTLASQGRTIRSLQARVRALERPEEGRRSAGGAG